MSRTRKLYVSELIKRNTNLNFDYVVIDNNITKDKDSKDNVLLLYSNKQVFNWYISVLHKVIVIKIK